MGVMYFCTSSNFIAATVMNGLSCPSTTFCCKAVKVSDHASGDGLMPQA